MRCANMAACGKCGRGRWHFFERKRKTWHPVTKRNWLFGPDGPGGLQDQPKVLERPLDGTTVTSYSGSGP